MPPHPSNSDANRIPRAFINLNENCILVLTEEDGTILDTAIRATFTNFTGIYDYIRKSILQRGNIRDLFLFPEKIEPERPPWTDAENPQPPFYGEREGMFTFPGQNEEFYSSLPLVYVRVFRHSESKLLCSIRLSSFFTKILSENHLHPFFAINNENLILAFNKNFLMLINANTPITAKALLGRPLDEFLLPTPRQMQRDELSRIIPPASSAFSTIYENHFTGQAPQNSPPPVGRLTEKGLEWRQATSPDNSEAPGVFILPAVFEWLEEDILLELTLAPQPDNLPCFILGDPELGNVGYPDHNGYLLGPGPFFSALLPQKRGLCLYTEKAAPEVCSGRTYQFYRLGNAFMLQCDHKTIFAFIDHELLKRGKTALSLFLRAGTQTVIQSVVLRKKASDKQNRTHNFFVSFKGNLGGYYLLSYSDSFTHVHFKTHVTVFKLQDMTDIRDRLEHLQSEYVTLLQKEQEMKQLLREYREEEGAFIGSGKTLSLIRDQAEKVAQSSATTLIAGPTGTGKEVLAKFIHQRSAFASGPFIKVDCSTLPPTLMESLLFGHEKGAFTGAVTKKAGYFEQANKGTLFLDEINNLSLDIQAKLLQFLQDYTVTPVGGQRPIKLNLRIIVASNVSLEDKIAQGLFREDLYYRIAVIILKLPPLRERLEDIPALVRHFLDIFNGKYHRNIRGLSPDAYKRLYSYAWPGNIRELKNVVERAFLFCHGAEIGADLITYPDAGNASSAMLPFSGVRQRKTLTTIEKSPEEVLALFRRCNGVVKRIADELQVTRRTLYNYFEKHDIRPNALRINPRRGGKK